jgi:glycosyltransferase involved in cell wall biosynthesis
VTAAPIDAEPAPLVSVAVTTYNVAPFIEAALDSVAIQDYRPLEVVIHDDASEDGTIEAVEAFSEAQQFPVLISRARRNAGPFNALKEALARCSGRYVAILDGDDVWLPGKLTAQVEWLERDPARVLCGHDVECFDSDSGEVLWTVKREGRLTHGSGPARAIRHGPLYPTSAVIVRREAIPEDFNPFALRGYTDWCFWADCLAGGGAYGYVPGLLSRYRHRGGGIVGSISRSREVATEFLDHGLVWLAGFEAEHPEYRHECARRRGVLVANHGKWLIERGDPDGARGYLRASVGDLGSEAWKPLGLLALTALPAPLTEAIYRFADRLRLGLRNIWRRAFEHG